MEKVDALETLDEKGWRRGFRNLLRHENEEWWGTRRWWMRAVIWTILINGLIFLMIWFFPLIEDDMLLTTEELVQNSLALFINLLGFFGAIGVMIYAQGAIVGEKETGTVAWILTKPVSRPAFVLSKLVANFYGVLIIIVVLQSAIYNLQIIMRGVSIDLVSFLGAIGLITLSLFFYLSLVIMLGTFFNSRRPVLGISLGLLIGQLIFSELIVIWLPWFRWIEPVTLMSFAEGLVQGESLPEQWLITVITIAILSFLFIAVAIWRFDREEF